jgi:hypothetical protein
MSVDLSGEITAIATVALAVFAVVTAGFALLAYRKQAQEVDILLAERRREAGERRRAQAARVFTWVRPDPPRLITSHATNASDFPVYDAQLWYPANGSLPDPDDLGMIMPTTSVNGQRPMPVRDALATTTLTFRDAEGIRWIRMPDGTLIEQTCATACESILAALGQPQPSAPEAT